MKKTLLFLLASCLLSFSAAAEKIAGHIVTNTNDTLSVTFEIPVELFTKDPDFERLQQKVKYYDEKGKKQTLKPDDAKEFSFEYESATIRMVSRYNSLGLLSGITFSSDSNIFLNLVEDGPVQLFVFYFTQGGPGVYNGSTGMTAGGVAVERDKYILQKGSQGKLTQVQGISFKRDMSEFFSDCPELVKKIEEKEFKKGDTEAMVRFYNEQCGG